MKLGSKPSEPTSADESPKISYPSFSLNDSAVEEFKKEVGDCEVGDEYEALVKFKVSGIRDDEFGKSLTLSVVEIGDAEHLDYDDEEEAPKSKYKNPAVGAALKK